MALQDIVMWLIREYKPTRSLLHNLVYLMDGIDENFMHWSISITGVYSEKIDYIVENLIRKGLIIECSNGRLTIDKCPSDDIDGHKIVSQAVFKYLLSLTMKAQLISERLSKSI
ncbi:hypothetical protein Smar_0062 [Staphylothermus marinus F1]|uniref:Uncharacterized protein n=1 Tax=Staphylothermus marinus (strain ATCC 43588 / DSM 3639 / JCM 9404 / F1) TaxID=399550 RepID=A3DKL5_STAMF|nr:hypothetical protein [Staphylothermus marinus]ABN69175.1 hypothetical protein Smar_0062 [Staphylothermus marinus F1]